MALRFLSPARVTAAEGGPARFGEVTWVGSSSVKSTKGWSARLLGLRLGAATSVWPVLAEPPPTCLTYGSALRWRFLIREGACNYLRFSKTRYESCICFALYLFWCLAGLIEPSAKKFRMA